MTCIHLNNKAASLILSCKAEKAIKCLNNSLLETCDAPCNISAQRPVAPKINWLDRSNSLGKTKRCHAFDLEYDEGMRTFFEPLYIPVSKKYFAISNEIIRSTVLYNLGIAHMHFGDDDEALAYFSMLIDDHRNAEKTKSKSMSSKDDFTGPSIVAVLNNTGHIHYRASRYEEALASYEESIEIRRVCSSYYHLDIASALNSIGVVRLYSLCTEDSKDLSKTLGFFVEAHSIRNAVVGHDKDRHTATLLNNIGRVKYITGHYRDAFAFYSMSRDIRQTVLGSSHLDVAATLNNMAQASNMFKDRKAALHLYEEYLDIVSDKMGMNHVDVASAVRSMAEVHEDAGDLKVAKEYYLQAINFYRDTAGVVDFEISSILNKLGNILYIENDFDKAIDLYQQGLRIEQQIYDGPNGNIAITFLNIARIHQTKGEVEDAIAYYIEAANIQRALGESEALNLACTVTNIGLLLDDSALFDSAIEAYEEVLSLRSKHLGNSHFEVSSTLNAMGMANYKIGSLDIALKCFSESLSIRRVSPDATNDDIATVLYNLGSVQVEIGNSGEAVRCFTQCATLEKSSARVKYTNLLSTLKRLGRVHLMRDESSAALQCFNDAVNICRTNEGRAIKAQLPIFLCLVGNCHLALNQREEAMTAFCNGMRANREVGINEVENLVDVPLDYYLMSAIKSSQCAAAA